MIAKIRLVVIIIFGHITLFSNCSAQENSHFDTTLSYPDSIIYLFNTDVIPKADAEPVRPMLFKIKLPPGLMSTYTAGFDAFGFRYPEKQAVYVYLDRFSVNTQDTAFHITEEVSIERLLLDKLSLINHINQMDVNNNPFNPVRDTWVIKRGKATILLYNIRKEDITRFRDYATCFTFLRS